MEPVTGVPILPQPVPTTGIVLISYGTIVLYGLITFQLLVRASYASSVVPSLELITDHIRIDKIG